MFGPNECNLLLLDEDGTVEKYDTERDTDMMHFRLCACDQSSQNGWTPLRLAAWRGNAIIARRLLAAGAKPNAATAVRAAPLLFPRPAGISGTAARCLSPPRNGLSDIPR